MWWGCGPSPHGLYFRALMVDVFYCSAVSAHCLCVYGKREKLLNKNGVDQPSLYPKVRSIPIHPFLMLATYILYYTPPIPLLFFYKKPKLKVENDRPDITEPIRTHSLSLSGFI